MTTDQLRRPLVPWPPIPLRVQRRKVFISYTHLDQGETDAFVRQFGGPTGVFTPKMIGRRADLDRIDSTNPDYVMQKIRGDYVQDSTVTIVLVGLCTHSRRYVDWEIKASLRRGEDNLPNGLIAIQLSSCLNGADLPERLLQNWTENHVFGYARYWRYPQNSEQLRGWIEDAFSARTTRSASIRNPQSIMARNSVCRVHGFAH